MKILLGYGRLVTGFCVCRSVVVECDVNILYILGAFLNYNSQDTVSTPKFNC